MALALVNLYSLLLDLLPGPLSSSTTSTSTSTTLYSRWSSDQTHLNTGASRMEKALTSALQLLAKSTLAVRQLIKHWLFRICRFRKSRGRRSSKVDSSSTLGPGGKALGDFQKEVEVLLATGTALDSLLLLSDGLQRQFTTALKGDLACMLPSYNHQFPTGYERGKFVALDVGGSTFRVAVIELLGPEVSSESGTVIESQDSYKISNDIRKLEGVAFFDWVAERIQETMRRSSISEAHELLIGMAWSFPIEQTSLRSGLIQNMGKGFMAAAGLLGQDLGDVLEAACARKRLIVKVKAIINDGSATFLAKSYINTRTHFGLILGTGVNIAFDLNVKAFGESKFGVRPPTWLEAAEHVLVNTELGMFGKDVLPFTRWDIQLNDKHDRPHFQPLEHFVSGRYLGEVVRLVLVEAVREAGLFAGVLPQSLEECYSLDTETLSRLSSSESTESSRRIFEASHPTTFAISSTDLIFIKSVAWLVSNRAAAILASAIHALWRLRSNANEESHAVTSRECSTIACNGSVILQYPGFKQRCQQHLDDLVETSGHNRGTLRLEVALESSLIGAAVAVACK